MIISCGEGGAKLSDKVNYNFASQIIHNGTLTRQDSAKTILILKAPLIKQYEFIANPTTLFPKGVHITYFKKGNPNPGLLTAGYAKIIEKKDWYEGRNGVIFVSPEKDTLKSKTLFWNKRKQMIFTKDSTIIIRSDSSVIYAHNGLEAAEDFSWYKLFNNNNSIFKVKD